ncbi:MAG: YraN family protein [Acidobacteria bacterium]|nr:YraN family protein [Acidobacteriota bacterium]
MPGRLVHGVVRALDAIIRPLGRSPDLPPHILTGRRGEEEAYFYLRRLGYTMVARNWRSPHHSGEIDLIGWEGDVLCFVEVKTRTTREVKPAEAAVDREKQREIASVARAFMNRMSSAPRRRYDILSVYLDCEPPEFTLFRNAFAVS